MVDRAFVIPTRDNDLLIASDDFYVESLVTSVEEIQGAVEAIEQSIKRNDWSSVENNFAEIFSIIHDPSLVDEAMRMTALTVLHKLVEKYFVVMEDIACEKKRLEASTGLNTSAMTDDDGFYPRLIRFRHVFQMSLYLCCRLFAINQTQYAKAVGRQTEGLTKFIRLRPRIVEFVERVVFLKVEDRPALNILFERHRPDRIALLLINTLMVVLSDYQNGLARSDIRNLHKPIFAVFGALAQSFRCFNGVAQGLMDNAAHFDNTRKDQFVYISAIMEMDKAPRNALLQRMLRIICSEDSEKVRSDKVKTYTWLVSTLAAKLPEVLVPECRNMRKFIRSEMPVLRSMALQVIGATVEHYFRTWQHKEKAGDIDYLLDDIVHFFSDDNANVKSRACALFARLATEEHTLPVANSAPQCNFPDSFFGRGVILQLAEGLTDTISVRKATLAALTEILIKNPFGPNLDVDEIHPKLNEAHDKLHDDSVSGEDFRNVLPNAQRPIRQHLTVVYTAWAASRAEGDFPQLSTEPLSAEELDDRLFALAKRYLEFNSGVEDLALQAANLVLVNDPTIAPPTTPSRINDLVDRITMAFVAYCCSLQQLPNADRQEMIDEEKEDRARARHAVLTEMRERLVRTIHFAMNMETAMGRAVELLNHCQAYELTELVRFITACRKFNLRGSETAVKRLFRLVFRTDAEIATFITDAAIDIFVSLNTNEEVGEKSTLQNVLQVMQHCTVEERKSLIPILVRLFQTDKWPSGATTVLWKLADDDDVERARVALWVLDAYALAYPEEVRTKFDVLIDLLGKQDGALQIDVMQIMISAAVQRSDQDHEILKDFERARRAVVKPFRIPNTDGLFSTIVRILALQLHLTNSRNWNLRCQKSLQVIYAYAEEPNAIATALWATVFSVAKERNANYLVFRHLWVASAIKVRALRSALRAHAIDMAPRLDDSLRAGVDFVSLADRVANLSITDPTVKTEPEDDTPAPVTLNSRNATCRREYRKLFGPRTRRRKNRTALLTTKGTKWLAASVGGMRRLSELLGTTRQGLAASRDVGRMLLQHQRVFVAMKNARRTWSVSMQRLFFFTAEYAKRTLQFCHESVIKNYSRTTKALEAVRKLNHLECQQLNIEKRDENHRFTTFELDTLMCKNIFATKGRMESATEQNAESSIATQLELCLGWDLFKPDSVLFRVYPVLMSVLRFRQRRSIPVDLADTAVNCLLKMMLLSPALCQKHLTFIYYYLRTARPTTRSNIIVSLADIAIRHSAVFARRLDLYLDLVHDSDPEVRLTALLAIYKLSNSRAVHLNAEQVSQWTLLLCDSDKRVVEVVQLMLHKYYQQHEKGEAISSLCKHAFERLRELRAKDFDFKPIATHLLQYVDGAKNIEATTRVFCNLLASCAADVETDDYSLDFAMLLLRGMTLYPKSAKCVTIIYNCVDKLSKLLRNKDFFKGIVHVVQSIRLKTEAKVDVAELLKKLNDTRRNIRKAKRAERRMRPVNNRETETEAEADEDTAMDATETTAAEHDDDDDETTAVTTGPADESGTTDGDGDADVEADEEADEIAPEDDTPPSPRRTRMRTRFTARQVVSNFPRKRGRFASSTSDADFSDHGGETSSVENTDLTDSGGSARTRGRKRRLDSGASD